MSVGPDIKEVFEEVGVSFTALGDSPWSGEYFKVETIKKRRYQAVDVVELAQDTR